MPASRTADGSHLSSATRRSPTVSPPPSKWHSTWARRSRRSPCPVVSCSDEVPMFRVRVVSSYVAGLMLHWFGGSKATREFHFPRVVLRCQEMMQGFLDGYCDGDGTELKGAGRGARMIISANDGFLDELAAVLGNQPSRSYDGSTRRKALTSRRHWHRRGWYGQARVPRRRMSSSFLRMAPGRKSAHWSGSMRRGASRSPSTSVCNALPTPRCRRERGADPRLRAPSRPLRRAGARRVHPR